MDISPERKAFSIRYPDDENLIAEVVGNLARKHPDLASLSKREVASFRLRVESVATALFLDDLGKYTAYEPDPTGRTLYVARYLPDVLERNVAWATECLIVPDMSNPKKKKRRKLPKNIVEKPDREVMTRIFGKRIIKKVDQVLGEHSKSPRKRSME